MNSPSNKAIWLEESGLRLAKWEQKMGNGVLSVVVQAGDAGVGGWVGIGMLVREKIGEGEVASVTVFFLQWWRWEVGCDKVGIQEGINPRIHSSIGLWWAPVAERETSKGVGKNRQ